jgi:hypothetical protein
MPGFATKGAIEIPLEVLGGRVTEMAPTDLPEGVSPDEQDNTYIPGAVLTRPCLERVLTNGPVDTTVTYQKSFVMPTGAIRNLYLFSNGELFWEDPINAPKVGNLLYTGPPGSYAKSATMFGREYIALSDGLHGTDVPLQWDGTYLDRVTQDGPAWVPAVTSIPATPAQMASSGNTLTRSGNIVTANLASAPYPPLQIGYQAQISNVPDSNSTTVNQTITSPYPSGQSSGAGNLSDYDGKTWRTQGNGSFPLSDFVVGGLNFSIPSTATILGVAVNFNIFAQSLPTSGTIAGISLWQTGAQLGTEKTPGTAFTSSIYPGVNQSYGGAADLWGASLTPIIVNDPSFGFAVAVDCPDVRLFLVQPFTVTVYYTLSGSGTVGIISSIVIDNESNPGLALVTTTQPHGLAPEEYVSIVGVEPGAVANISAAQWSSGRTTITTSTSHRLTIGSVISVASVTTATGSTTFSFNGTFTVETIPNPDQITYTQTPITATDPDVINATASTGNITISWPIPDTPTPSYFQVESAPSPTTFLVPITYCDGTWTTGTVGFIWEGTFYVTNVISPTQFQYQQYGPNGSTSAVGTVTPFGQAAPGFHLMRVNYLTRQGAILKPSPYVKFIANGGEYLQVASIPIGPSNIVARILEFTGADGAYFFYLPVPAQVNGQIVSTATQINDNVTTTILLDFSDNSLFGGIATSIPGNDLLSQIVLDGALGFGQYATRLITYGQRNKIQNLLNMGFDADAAGTDLIAVQGWQNLDGTPTWTIVSLASRPTGGQLELVCNPITHGTTAQILWQSAYADAYGNPILAPNMTYKVRFWISVPANSTVGGFVQFDLYSASTTFDSYAAYNIGNAAFTGYAEATFNGSTPVSIPPDLQLILSGGVGLLHAPVTVVLDELEIIPIQTPYLDGVLFGSYGNNQEGIDGVTGKFGPVTDTRKVMDFGILRETFYMLTQEPSGRLHETTDNGTTEPSGWTVNEVGANCGALSAFSLTKSQADDMAASGGEEWMAWASLSGARIFGGAYPDKISQEIQPDWEQINPAAALTVWAVNDPVERALYFGVPLGSATAPNKLLFMSYRQLDSAQSIAGSPPFRVSFTGKLIATDNSRKWSLWNMSMNSAALMYREAGTLSLVLGGGNGLTPGVGGFGNVYTLNPNKYTDDDYGQVSSYYFTYGFVNRGAEQQLQVGSHQKGFFGVLATVTWPAGTMLVQVAPNNPANLWPLSCERTVSQPNIDLQWGYGGMIIARGSRFFLKFSSVPLEGQTDNAYNLQMVTVALIATRLKTRGAAQ